MCDLICDVITILAMFEAAIREKNNAFDKIMF